MEKQNNDNSNPECVLIADDSLTQLSSLKHKLEEYGYVVLTALDGAEALEKAKSEDLDLIISDIDMPVMDGYAFSRAIKSNIEMCHIPVVLLSSLSDPDFVLKGLNSQADFFVEKSEDFEIIISCVHHVKENHKLQIENGHTTDIQYAYNGKIHELTTSPHKILNYFLATYETALTKMRSLHERDEALREEIEERKILESKLEEAKQAAEAASRAKSTFLSSMSHEIRTPMNAILGFAQLMHRDSSFPKEHRDSLETILNSGEHLLGLINDILDISKVEAGRVNITPNDFCLMDLLHDVEEMIRVKTDSKNLRLIFDIDEDLHNLVRADEGKVRQILLNLLSNAAKFTSEGGIAVRARTSLKEDGRIRVDMEVEDTGYGISKKDQGKLFKVFQQTESSVKEGGTGLGLALSRKYARLMDGDITVTSQLGKGSCFHVTLVFEKGAESKEKFSKSSKKVIGVVGGAEQYRILIVDDRKVNRKFLHRLLGRIGFKLELAKSGEEAVQIAEIWKPKLVLMDVRMQGMDGLEATRLIKKQAIDYDVRVIMVTATAFNDEFKALMDSGADEYIRKPFKVDDLLEKIGGCLHLKYEYEEDVEEVGLSREALEQKVSEVYSVETKKEMYIATLNAQLDRLIELIEHGRDQSPQVADWLREMATNYQYEVIMNLMEQEGNDEQI